MAQSNCDIDISFGFDSLVIEPMTYENRLEQALDTVKAAIIEAPEGSYFGIDKVEGAKGDSSEPVIRFTCHFDLPHQGS